jgi:hypothetical protein
MPSLTAVPRPLAVLPIGNSLVKPSLFLLERGFDGRQKDTLRILLTKRPRLCLCFARTMRQGQRRNEERLALFAEGARRKAVRVLFEDVHCAVAVPSTA